MQVPRIHLIETRYDIAPSEENPTIHESCCWKYLDEETCRNLMHGKVYFHLTKTSEAHTSGTIIGFRPGGRRRPESVFILFRKDEPTEAVYAESLDNWQPVGMEHRGIYPYRQIVL